MSAAQKMIKARAALVLDSPFFGSLALRLKFEEMPGFDTMATDGVKLIYDPAWIETLSADELKGVLSHEVLHLAAAHHCRRGHRDHNKWNIAADHAINHILKDAGFKLPKDGLMDPQYKDMSADAIYAKLQQEPPKGNGQGSGKGAGQSQGQGQPGTPQQANDPGRCGGVMDYPGENGKPSPAEINQQAQDWQVAATQAAQAAKAYGKLPGSLARLVEDINAPKVNWREALQRFVNQACKNDYSWRRPNARYFGQGIILPGLYSEQLPPIAVAVDTSGSINGDDLKQFGGEIDDIIGQYNTTVNVFYCDTKIRHQEEFTPETRPVKLDAKGGGGTRFSPVMAEVVQMVEQPACLVYLTDGCCSDFGDDPGVPVMWVLTEKNRSFKPPFGETVQM